MGETVVVTPGDDEDEDRLGDAEHAAAVSEGAAEVHAENAAEAAEEAQDAAAVAAAEVDVATDATALAVEAAERAEAAALSAAEIASAMTTAIAANTEALQSFAGQLQQPKPSVEEKPKRSTPDRAPETRSKRKGDWYWGKKG